MSYTAAIDRPNPAAFVFLIDQSGSMEEKLDTGQSKADFVADVLNKTIYQLIIRCTRADGVRNYFDIGVLAYGGNGVSSGFGGELHGSHIHPILQLKPSLFVSKSVSKANPRPRSQRMAVPPQQEPRQGQLAIQNRRRPGQYPSSGDSRG
jgi:hypothetical protein